MEEMVDMYPKAYKEVIEILKNMPEEKVALIPNEMIKMFYENRDDGYEFKIDINKKLEEQELLMETKAILLNIFKDYWATDEEREEIINLEKFEEEKIEAEKRLRYNPDDLFKNRKKEIVEEKYEGEPNKGTALVEVKKKGFFSNFVGFIKNMLGIK